MVRKEGIGRELPGGWRWKTTLPPLRLESGNSVSGGSSGVLKDLLIHVFNEYLLSTYHVPGTIPVWDGTVNKKVPAFMDLTSNQG